MALPLEKLCHHYSLADIKLATENFNERLVVGEGGFGKVYKGHIKSEKGSSIVVAIKRLDLMSDQGASEFRAEIEMLSRLRHSNLVSLLGCCVDGKEMIIVYEYMPNGTVYHHLHKSNTPLSWMQILRVSIGAARGLDYLHTGAGTKHEVIHRDVKSSNILIDEDWAAKISDFGLAKICSIKQSSTYVNTTGIKGTFGYLDPDTVSTGNLTGKTDVYAFGVVLFELLSGRHAVFGDGDEVLSLARWAQNCIKKGNFDQLVSTEIRGRLCPKSLKKFAQIAYCCLHSDPKKRPTMSEVVVALQCSESLQEKFDNTAQPAGVFGLSWKLACYFVPHSKDKSEGNSDKKSSRNKSSVPAKNDDDLNNVHPESSGNRKINVNGRSIVPTDDGSDYNEVLPDHKEIRGYDLKHSTEEFRNEISWDAMSVWKTKSSSYGSNLVMTEASSNSDPVPLSVPVPVSVSNPLDNGPGRSFRNFEFNRAPIFQAIETAFL